MRTWNDTSIKIRLANPGDAAAIEKITKKAFKTYKASLPEGVPVYALSEGTEVVLRDIENKAVFVAESEGEVIGSVRLYPVGENMMYFSRFSVSPDAQSGGIGGQIVEAAREYSIAEGKDAMVLHTCTRALSLLKFYYANGFYVHDVRHDRGYARGTLVHELHEKISIDMEYLNSL